MPVAKPENLGRLPPRDLLRHRPQNHFLYLHRPLHCGLPVRKHASYVLLPHRLQSGHITCSLDRTFDVLTTANLIGVDVLLATRQNEYFRGGATVATRMPSMKTPAAHVPKPLPVLPNMAPDG